MADEVDYKTLCITLAYQLWVNQKNKFPGRDELITVYVPSQYFNAAAPREMEVVYKTRGLGSTVIELIPDAVREHRERTAKLSDVLRTQLRDVFSPEECDRLAEKLVNEVEVVDNE